MLDRVDDNKHSSQPNPNNNQHYQGQALVVSQVRASLNCILVTSTAPGAGCIGPVVTRNPNKARPLTCLTQLPGQVRLCAVHADIIILTCGTRVAYSVTEFYPILQLTMPQISIMSSIFPNVSFPKYIHQLDQ